MAECEGKGSVPGYPIFGWRISLHRPQIVRGSVGVKFTIPSLMGDVFTICSGDVSQSGHPEMEAAAIEASKRLAIEAMLLKAFNQKGVTNTS